MGVSRFRLKARDGTLRDVKRGSLDDIARRLAEPMPRSRALRIAAGAVVGLVTPLATARPAFSGTTLTSTCGPSSAPGSKSCDCPAADGLFMKNCCGPGHDCVCYSDRAECHKIVCPSGHEWCGAVPCCKPGETCSYDGSKYSCECAGQKCGASKCCTSKQTCVKGSCCPNTRVCGPKCCPSGQKCAFVRELRLCCPTNRIITKKFNGTNIRFCCPPGTVKVGGQAGQGCCPPTDQKCCDDWSTPLVGGLRIFCVRGKDQVL